MARRIKPWKDLSPSYRRRLTRAGITPTMRRQGVDLRSVRGHPLRHDYSAPAGMIGIGTPNEAQVAERRVWRETLAPGWLPNRQRMSDATAVALSQLRPPSTWREVHFTPAPAGQSWTMEVVYVRGHPQVIQLPPDAYREVLDLLTFVQILGGYVGDEAAWDNFIDRGRDFDVSGTP